MIVVGGKFFRSAFTNENLLSPDALIEGRKFLANHAIIALFNGFAIAYFLYESEFMSLFATGYTNTWRSGIFIFLSLAIILTLHARLPPALSPTTTILDVSP